MKIIVNKESKALVKIFQNYEDDSEYLSNSELFKIYYVPTSKFKKKMKTTYRETVVNPPSFPAINNPFVKNMNLPVFSSIVEKTPQIEQDNSNYTDYMNSFDNEFYLQGLREYRTYLLKESDWTQTNDCPLSEEQKTSYATYRQLLRDLPETFENNAKDVIFPTV